MVDINNDSTPTVEKEVSEETKVETEQQDPLKQELENVNRGKRSRKEKLLYTKKRIEEQLKAEGITPEEESEYEDDEAPLTKGEFKRIQQEQTIKTALQLADDIENETERELVKFHINNTIRSTGNPKEDLRLARALANDVKNKQILEQIQGKPEVKRASSQGGGVPPKEEEPEFTEEELSFMRPPFNMSKVDVINARKKAEQAGDIKGVASH